MMYNPLFCLTLLAAAASSSLAQPTNSLTTTCYTDAAVGLTVCALPVEDAGIVFPVTTILADEEITLLSGPVNELSQTRAFDAVVGADTTALYFTSRPLIKLTTTGTIPNEPKRYTLFEYAHGDHSVTSHGGIEIRGASALSFPKKSYDIELHHEPTGTENRDEAFLGMRSDDDWVLDALYNEPARINAVAAHKLWLRMHDLAWAPQDDRAEAGADLDFVEVFLNGDYLGLYGLGEQVDRKQLRLKKLADDGRVRGYNVKVWAIPDRDAITVGAPPSPADAVWDGFEMKYPRVEDTIAWEPLRELTDFFVTATDEAVARDAARYLDIDNAIDYNLFVNVVGGIDNTEKNFYIVRRDEGEPFHYIPWDLDGTFGNNWDGQRVRWEDTLFTPLFHERLFTAARPELLERRCDRYAALRNYGPLRYDSLASMLSERHAELTDGRFFEREAMVWGTSLAEDIGELTYTLDWVETRLTFLDEAICDGRSVVSAEEQAGPAAASAFEIVGSNVVDSELSVHVSRATTLFIVDVLGRRVSSRALAAGTHTIDLDSAAPGQYFVRAGNTTRVVLRR